MSNFNTKVAAINGLGLLNPDLNDARSRTLLNDCLDTLEQYYLADLGSGEQQVQAHVPTAIAKLLHDVRSALFTKRKDYYKQLFLDELTGRSKLRHSKNEITQSCALALGQMAKP